MASTKNSQGLLVPDDPNATSSASLSGNPNAQGPATTNPFQNAGTVTPVAQGGSQAATPLQQFAFNPTYEAQNRAIQQRLSDAGADKQNSINSLEAGYQNNIQDANASKKKAMQTVLSRMTGAGMGNSSVSADAQGELETDFNKYLGTLATSRGNQMAGYEDAFNRVGRNAYTDQADLISHQRKDDQDRADAAAQQKLQAEQAQRQADAQAQQTAALIASQQASMNRQPAGPAPAQNYSNSAYSGGWGGGGFEDLGITSANTEPEILGYINQSKSIPDLNRMMQAPQLTSQMWHAITDRIGGLQNSMVQQNAAQGPYTGKVAAKPQSAGAALFAPGGQANRPW